MRSVALRSLLILMLCSALSACQRNQVLSIEPLFFKADRRGAPKFRAGIWASPTPDCPMRPEADVKDWPECAHAFVVGRSGLNLHGSDRDGAFDMLLANGDPLVLQTVLKNTKAEQPSLNVSYQAVQPTAFDARARTTAFRIWNVLCGPPPAPGSESALTAALLPDLTPVDQNCLARDPDAVRRAAAASAVWASGEDDVANPRWIRAARWWAGEAWGVTGGAGLSPWRTSKPAERTEAAAEAQAEAEAAAAAADGD